MSTFERGQRVRWVSQGSEHTVLGKVETTGGEERVVMQRLENSASISVVLPSALIHVQMCEYNNKGPSGDCGQRNTADWVVFREGMMPCCGASVSPVKYVCDDCWALMNSRSSLKHNKCDKVLDMRQRWSVITKVVYLS